MTALDREVLVILEQLPSTWTRAQAETVKAAFQALRPDVPAKLATRLWRYWELQYPNAALFNEPEADVALLLHARAHGAMIPGQGDDGLPGSLLLDYAELFAPLAPDDLPWGPAASLSPAVRASLSSPVMDAWVLRKGATPTLVLILGEGLPEIRQQVLTAAFMASLTVFGLDTDLMNVGALQVELPDHDRPTLDLPIQVLGDYRGQLVGDSAETAEQALYELVGLLQEFAQRTGLVRLHEASLEAYRALRRTLRQYSGQKHGPPILWVPGDADPGAGEIERASDVVGLVPYFEIPSKGVLQISFNGDLLTTRSYQRLEQAYRLATVARIVADVQTRLAYHEREAERHRREAEDYSSTPIPDRISRWGETVQATHEYNFEVDVNILLPTPRQFSSETYYTVIVPSLAEQHLQWQLRMRRIWQSIELAVRRPDAPLRRLAASRFLDAALRGRRPDESPVVSTAFDVWSDEIRPMLLLEWRCFLRNSGISPRDVFTRHSVFHTWQVPASDGRRAEQLAMSPFTVVDRFHSAAVFDADRRVMVIQDATDHAEHLDSSAQTAEEHWSRLVAMSETSAATGDSLDTALEEFRTGLLDALRKAPHDTMARLLAVLGDPNGSGVAEADALKSYLAAAVREAALPRGMHKASIAVNVGAYQTAMSYLEAIRAQGEREARVWLLYAVVAFLAAGQDPRDAHDTFGISDAGLPHGFRLAFRRALERAHQAEPAYVDQWLEQLDGGDFGRVVTELLHELPPVEALCDERQLAALVSRVAAESARLARALERAASSLAEEGESIEATFAKVGRELEDLFLAEFAGGFRDEAVELLSILTGRQPLRYGGV